MRRASMSALVKTILFGALLFMLFSCDGKQYDGPISASIIVSHRSNIEAVPVNTKEIVDQLYDTVFTYAEISIVSAEGKPRPVFHTRIPAPKVDGLSDNKLQTIADGYVKQIQEELKEVQATTAEVDLLGAIRIAAQQLSDAPGEKVMLIFDTGISTKSYIDMTTDILYADPTEVVSWLEKEHAIPDLSGIDVEWYFPATAVPQEPLNEDQKYRIRMLWEAVLKAGNVRSVIMKDVTYGTEGYADMPYVSTIDVAEPSGAPEVVETVVLDEGQVKFCPNSSEFHEPEKAEAELKAVAEMLCGHPDRVVYVAGATATPIMGDIAFSQSLSEARAEAVAQTLIRHGVSADRMIVVGLGADRDPWHRGDVDNGSYIEAEASRNRKTMIIDVESEDGQLLASWMRK